MGYSGVSTVGAAPASLKPEVAAATGLTSAQVKTTPSVLVSDNFHVGQRKKTNEFTKNAPVPTIHLNELESKLKNLPKNNACVRRNFKSAKKIPIVEKAAFRQSSAPHSRSEIPSDHEAHKAQNLTKRDTWPNDILDPNMRFWHATLSRAVRKLVNDGIQIGPGQGPPGGQILDGAFFS